MIPSDRRRPYSAWGHLHPVDGILGGGLADVAGSWDKRARASILPLRQPTARATSRR